MTQLEQPKIDFRSTINQETPPILDSFQLKWQYDNMIQMELIEDIIMVFHEINSFNI